MTAKQDESGSRLRQRTSRHTNEISHVAAGLFQVIILSLIAAVTVLSASVASSQQPRYSQSAEYQAMLAEMHSEAPSPAYIATGVRPKADANLKVNVQTSESSVQLSTKAARLVWSQQTGTLVWTSLVTGKSWSLGTLPDSALQTSQASVPCETNKPLPGSYPGEGNSHWLFSCGSTGNRMEVEFIQADIVRVTFAGSNTTDSALDLHVEGSGPWFGLGERFGQAALTGTSLDVRPQDRYGEPGHDWTYVAVPFVYSASGLGMYADTAFDTQFRFDQIDTSYDLRLTTQPVPIYLFAEPSPKAVLSAYTGITGRPPIPPQWTFGPWITALQGKGALLDVAKRIRVEGVPASALWIYDEQDEANNLGWPFWFNSYYGDPRALNDALHSQGFRVLTYVHPYVRDKQLPFTTTNPVFSRAVADHLIQTNAAGKPAGPNFENIQTANLDFSNPQAVDLWQDMITNAVKGQGFDGWMEDFGEWVRDGDRFAAGTSKTMSELYPLLYHKVTLRVAQALNPAIAPFVRSGSSGSQGFSVVMWGADQYPNYSRDYGLPSVLTAGITAGMSGYSTWGPDILSTGSDKELWMRWVEFGALTPVMRDHVWMKPEHSWNLWSDAETSAHWRRLAVLHSSLLPYFTTLADEAHRTGVPIMRHLALGYPKDPLAVKAEYEYLLGEDMLVAPVISGGTSLRTFYLPQGEWINFWSGDHLTGGQNVTVSSALGEIPIAVRAGSLLPFKPEAETARMDWNDPHLLDSSLVWKAYPSKSGTADRTFTLPNGTTARFLQEGSHGSIQGTGKVPLNYEVVLRTMVEPTETRLNGQLVGAINSNPRRDTNTQYWWNPSTFEMHLLFHTADFKVEVSGIQTSLY